jgi:hypothetical protein
MKRAIRENLTYSRMTILASSPDKSGQAIWQLKYKL